MSRILVGAIAGTVATLAMTATMRRLHHRLPAEESYPLPPREILERMDSAAPFAPSEDRFLADATLAAHFGYGALAGALYPLLTRHRGVSCGAAYGVLVWGASYLGWIPAARILVPATRHPARRNLLMLTAHLAWGAGVSLSLRELEKAEQEIFRGRRAKDAYGVAGRPEPEPQFPRASATHGGRYST